jgi:hypothetical protein
MRKSLFLVIPAKRAMPPCSKQKAKRDSSRKFGAQNDELFFFSQTVLSARGGLSGLRAWKCSWEALKKLHLELFI